MNLVISRRTVRRMSTAAFWGYMAGMCAANRNNWMRQARQAHDNKILAKLCVKAARRDHKDYLYHLKAMRNA